MREPDTVLIIGAGLSGLACAITLQKLGIPYLILESSSRVGGRIKTDRTEDGFLLDHGFQVLLNSYPNLSEFLDLNELDLKKFSSGAIVWGKKSNFLLANPFKHPSRIFASLFSLLPTWKDKILVTTLVIRAQSHAHVISLLGETTRDYLTNYGFSKKFIEKFWRPFLGGVFLDSSLAIDANFFLFLMRCFSLGSVSVPAQGMEAIPKQMLKQLNTNQIKLSSPVVKIGQNHVELASGEIIKGFTTVQTYQTDRSNYRSVTTFYFSGPIKPDWKKWLVLVPPELGLNINQIVLMSEVSPAYAPIGKVLISASVLTHRENSSSPLSIDAIQEEINVLAKKDLKLSHLRTYTISHALPELTTNQDFVRAEGRYFCGDYLSSPSIYGALKSGKNVALAIAKSRDRRV